MENYESIGCYVNVSWYTGISFMFRMLCNMLRSSIVHNFRFVVNLILLRCSSSFHNCDCF